MGNGANDMVRQGFPAACADGQSEHALHRKGGISRRGLNALKRLAAFRNPEFFKAQAMRLSTYGKPPIISCSEETPAYLCLPRGCETDVMDLFDEVGVKAEWMDQIGQIGAGKSRPSGMIDVAIMQSISRGDEVKEWIKHYGMVIVDECHHVPAFLFERILKGVHAKTVYGLTSTIPSSLTIQPFCRYTTMTC